MLRRTCTRAMLRPTVVALEGVPNGLSFGIGGVESKGAEAANVVPTNERGLKASAMFDEGLQTANYDALFGAWSWTYMQPVAKVNVEKMPAPEAKYYQVHTKKPWDVSSTDYVEIMNRKRFFFVMWWGSLMLFMFFVMPKEKQFSGKRGADGWWIGLPKNKPEMFA